MRIIYHGLLGNGSGEARKINNNMKLKNKVTTGVFLCNHCNKTWELYYIGERLHYMISPVNLPTFGIERQACPMCKQFKFNGLVKQVICDNII